MEEEYYTIEEIREKFISYRDPKHSVITKREYEIFCSEIEMIPKTTVNTIDKEIYFVLMSARPGKGTPACYVNLRKDFDEKKNGIVVLSPYIFGAIGKDNNGNDKKYCEGKDGKIILHEIAHHVLNHSNEDFEKEDKDAEEQVEEWRNDFTKKERRRLF